MSQMVPESEKMDGQYTTENLNRGLDFTSELTNAGLLFTGIPTVTAVCNNGLDTGSPIALSVGAPTLDPTSMIIIVPLSGGVSGAQYRISFSCKTTNGLTVRRDGLMFTV